MLKVEFYRAGNRVFLGSAEMAKIPTEGSVIDLPGHTDDNPKTAWVEDVLTRRSSAGTVIEVLVRD